MPPLVYELLLVYIAAMTLVSVAVTVYDKIAATHRPEHRTREATLLALSLLGGSVAMYITMVLIRHKTRHVKFMLGIPLIMIAQAALAFLCCYLLNR